MVAIDVSLYKPTKQLQLARDELNHFILRPGELHTAMTQLRAIRSYIDSSGIDLCRKEDGLYGSEIVNKSLMATICVRRGERAHVITLQTLFTLYHEAFRSNTHSLEKAARDCLKHLFVTIFNQTKQICGHL